jgi:hypothetical protein
MKESLQTLTLKNKQLEQTATQAVEIANYAFSNLYQIEQTTTNALNSKVFSSPQIQKVLNSKFPLFSILLNPTLIKEIIKLFTEFIHDVKAVIEKVKSDIDKLKASQEIPETSPSQTVEAPYPEPTLTSTKGSKKA